MWRLLKKGRKKFFESGFEGMVRRLPAKNSWQSDRKTRRWWDLLGKV